MLRNWSFFGYLKLYIKRVLSFFGFHYKASPSRSFFGFHKSSSFLCFLLVITCVYIYLFPVFHWRNHTLEISKSVEPNKECDFFDGKWVPDESYPLYNSSECPFAEKGFDCLGNGREDQEYLKWRWKPNDCEIPRFDAISILKRLRGKRVVFVGDSLSRTQWESMICMLMTGIADKTSVYEINGNVITKQIRHLGVEFSSFDLVIEFYRSVFLVQPGSAPKHSPKRVKSTLKVDVLDDISREWVDSDILVFNSGHWWTPTKLFEMGCYFRAGGKMKLGMSINSAFRSALSTWATWLENTVNTNKTRVFFRTFEASHWNLLGAGTCEVTEQPLTNATDREDSPFSNIILDTVKKLSVPVTVLHVTPMGASRSDAHVGTWSDNPTVPDCSHWCLPGVPDMWNEILFSQLAF